MDHKNGTTALRAFHNGTHVFTQPEPRGSHARLRKLRWYPQIGILSRLISIAYGNR